MGTLLRDPLAHIGPGRGLCCWQPSGCRHVDPGVRSFWNAARLVFALVFIILCCARFGETQIEPCALLVLLPFFVGARWIAPASLNPISSPPRLTSSIRRSIRPHPRI
jgi:hypothetical protein